MEKQAKLPKKFKEKWVKALRSGEYLQNKDGYLYNKRENNYCCLGVAGLLCGISKNMLHNEGWLSNENLAVENVPKILTGEKGVAYKLASYNDNGKSFKWIASYIERYL